MEPIEKLVRDLTNQEYQRLQSEIDALVFDTYWLEDEKDTIRKYLLKRQGETQFIASSIAQKLRTS